MTPAPLPRPPVTGNRLVLTGAVLYLLEWVAIIAGGIGVPLGGNVSAARVLDSYAGHADALGWAAGWFSVVLLGRLLVMVGLAAALTESGRPSRLMPVAVAAMAVSCALEVTAYAVAAGAGWTAATSTVATTRGLDAVSYMLTLMVWGPFGVSALCAGVAMWTSGLFRRALAILALVAGALTLCIGLAFTAPSLHGAIGALGAVTLVFWVWMVWTGVTLWRASGRGRRVADAQDQRMLV